MSDPVSYFLLILKATVLSFSGLGNLPSVHQDFVSRGWATDQQFGTAIAIGQLAPGPVGLWIVALGYLTAGLGGAALAASAIALPPLLVLPAARLHGRYAETAAMRGFMRGIALGVAGTLPVILIRIIAGYGVDLGGVAIVLGAAALVASRRVRLPFVLTLAVLAGLVLYR